MEPVRTVVEIARRGKLVVGEPYFTPGTPIVLDRKSLTGAERGDLAVVASGRGRAKVERVLGPAEPDRDRARGAARRARRAAGVRAVRAAGADARGPHRPPRADDVHDRPRHGEGLRRRDLGRARGRRRARLGAHRRRLALRRRRARRSTAAPPSGRSRPTSRASSRRCCRPSSPTTSARLRPHVDRLCVTVEFPPPSGEPIFYRSVIRSDARLTYGQAQRRDVPRRGRRRSSSSPPRTRPSCAGGASPAARCASSARRSSSSSTARAASPRALARASREAHALVEELMILANEAVAGLLAGRRREALYRVHERPDPQAIAAPAREARRPRRADAAGAGATLTPATAARVAAEVSERVTDYVAQSGRGREAFPALVLRSLKQARYDPRNLGHSGLASPRVLPLHVADPPLPRPRRPPRAAARARRSATTRCPQDLGEPRRAHLGARARGGADRVPRRRDLPRLAARAAALRARLGASRSRARSPA